MTARSIKQQERKHGQAQGGLLSAFSQMPGVFQTQEDWQVNKSVLECNKYMFEQQINCDVTFQFGGK